MSIVLSPEQATGLADLVEWWEDPRANQFFVILGYAGVGKSTLVSYAIEALEIDPMQVAFVTYTGKAALVLQNKGNMAHTIHHLIYKPIISQYTDPITKLKKSKVCGFELRDREELGNIRLLVIDEISMVSDKLLADLASFGIKILALGDPGQLPPVKGAANHLIKRPDVFLQTIHRQAADNPIIWASMKARHGERIPFGSHGGKLHVVRKDEIDLFDAIGVDQMLVCTNAVRRKYNHEMRAILGYEGTLPQAGEKLISLKNRWEEFAGDTPLVNGLMLRAKSDVRFVLRNSRTMYITAAIDGAEDRIFHHLETNLDFFEPIPNRQPDTDADVAHMDWGYAITTHKSQGSEWDSVLFYNDGFGDGATRRQLLYTGATRASKELILAL